MSHDILNSNFFELFELPVSYDVNLNKIQQHYMALQKQVHPDKFINASDQDKRLSMQQTSWINEAQTTLKNPVSRAIYLLKLKGIDINLENETTMDAAFLMQQLEMRECLENIKRDSDSLLTLDEIAKELKSANNGMMKNFAQFYEADEIENARECIRKLQFMQKAKNEVNNLIASIEDELMI
ncbi:Chaperone protein HscB [hydrothermal vent metagenome]|uniref:Chaperone protein HscB n=1 Tax=hydrothermal vent metagenome TaxID=652676 RepID=A0A3B0WKT4_9ZZZZ